MFDQRPRVAESTYPPKIFKDQFTLWGDAGSSERLLFEAQADRRASRREREIVGRICDSLLKFFDEDWLFTQNDEEAFLKLSYEGKAGEWNCFAQALEDQEQLVHLGLNKALV